MKKIIYFLVLVIANICLTSCSWFDDKTNVTVLGITHIKEEKGLLFVEFDSLRYVPTVVWTGKTNRDGHESMSPISGMEVTCYKSDKHAGIQYIAGKWEKEDIEGFHKKNYTVLVIFLSLLVAFLLSIFFYNDKKS